MAGDVVQLIECLPTMNKGLDLTLASYFKTLSCWTGVILYEHVQLMSLWWCLTNLKMSFTWDFLNIFFLQCSC